MDFAQYRDTFTAKSQKIRYSHQIFKDAIATIAAYYILYKIRYIRYVDEMSFSGDFDENKLLYEVRNSIEN